MKMSDIINISESFDSRFTDITWTKQGTVIIGNAMLDNENFLLEIGLNSIKISNNIYKYTTIEFYKNINGIMSQDLTGQNKNQSKIFGCIKNAFADKLTELDKKFNVDAVVTLVRTSFNNKPEKRIGLYKNMFSKNQGNTKWNWIGDFKFEDLIGSIFAKQIPDTLTLKNLKLSIQSRGKENIKI